MDKYIYNKLADNFLIHGFSLLSIIQVVAANVKPTPSRQTDTLLLCCVLYQ